MSFTEELFYYVKESKGGHYFRLIEKIWKNTEPGEKSLQKRRIGYKEEVNEQLSALGAELYKKEQEQIAKVELLIQTQDKERKKIRAILVKEPTEAPSTLKLFPREKWIRDELTELKAEKAERMGGYLALVERKEELEEMLGISEALFDKESIPSERTINSLQRLIDELGHEKEVRENSIFNLQERMTSLLGILGFDLNATSISSFIGVDSVSLKSKDIKVVENSLRELDLLYHVKADEVTKMLENIRGVYDKLKVPTMDRLALATGGVCGKDDLLSGDNLKQIEQENKRMNELKRMNMGRLLEGAMQTLRRLQEDTLRSEEEMKDFEETLKTKDIDGRLEAVEEEISVLTDYAERNRILLKDVWEILRLNELSHELLARMNDPKRLFNARGNQMFKEESDRKRVNLLPKKCDRLLELDLPEEVTVNGISLEIVIEDLKSQFINKSKTGPSKTNKPANSSKRTTRASRSANATPSMTASLPKRDPLMTASVPRLEFQAPSPSFCNSTEMGSNLHHPSTDISGFEHSILLGGSLEPSTSPRHLLPLSIDPGSFNRSRGINGRLVAPQSSASRHRSPSPGRGSTSRRTLRRSKSFSEIQRSQYAQRSTSALRMPGLDLIQEETPRTRLPTRREGGRPVGGGRPAESGREAQRGRPTADKKRRRSRTVQMQASHTGAGQSGLRYSSLTNSTTSLTSLASSTISSTTISSTTSRQSRSRTAARSFMLR